ncbi:two-component system regulatory protein YycI [Alicyclobacillus vulcanalis]|uniref:Two-component signal transduction system YycFG, regulatory protein YycI n=1 Tax=Alicyclobacillus vulcanalis TaxID=252246 RepID=A0A1N7LN74_9BACL|nr:two-component system regulatory protein YycI [Alicyclobacillus vulcanalis]SIS75239.1 Two-component signal transduction system YycFG, regulatory protein YycI [Alicyclobacillus vulcanalis]
MNWEVAKSWLIALFALLDGILGWLLYESRQLASGYAESPADALANTKTLLANQGFSLATSVPSGQPSLVTFQADFANPRWSALEQAAFPGAKGKVQIAGGTLTTSQGQITVTGQGTWAVQYQPPLQLSQNRGPLAYVFRGSDYEPDPTTSDPVHAVYLELVDGYPVFDADVIAVQQKGELLGYTQTYIDHVEANSPPKPVISALDALDSFAEAVDKAGSGQVNSVVKVDLGYARKIQVTSGSQAILHSYWFPVWRIVTTSGIYFVNAFTGEVEMQNAY